jgi:ABC-2 type transport system permease protein
MLCTAPPMADALELARPYFAVYRARFLLLLQYRTAALAGLTTQLWWGSMKLLVLAAFYAQAPHQPLSFPQAASYIWLVQAFLTTLPWGVDGEIELMMRTGNVAYERLRPLDTYWFWFARSVALRSAPPALRAGPIFLLSGAVMSFAGLEAWALGPPAGPGAAILFALSMAMAILLSAALTTLTSIRLVAMISGRGLNGLMASLVLVFSGMVLPLQLFPGWMQTALFFQPFSGLIDIPFRIYSGGLAGAQAGAGIACQIVWTAVFIGLGRAWMGRTMARVEVLGG